MSLPDFIRAFPALDLPFGEDIVSTNALRSDQGLVVFFTFHKDTELPAHAHKGQWGTVIAGSVTLTIDGASRTYRPGETYSIPSGVIHAVKVTAGTKAIDVFEEPDRYRLQS
ncbi:MAG: cupin domain-containing protein [Cypionkella sp.]